ncbi:glutamate/tyrosine decarboxylase-like PLP-dependent enzyme [Salinibacter ruber]|uniref:Glutamate/tyrosine decarboxylase-like PLP-dependent enzyme n=2 Tax=Salinibacter ruber TaxID=146919 RepID=A0AAW5P8X7_9BACT|nr:glutamate/tyrosine decarboxylase-like PLP-dependent enzyme [Salinibacter ruber]
MPMDHDRLELSPEKMRTLGYRVVDLLVDHFADGGDESLGEAPSRDELEAHLREDLPEEGTPPEAVLDQVEAEVLPNTMRVDHPRFFGFVPGPNNFVGVLADMLASGFNVFSGTWISGAAAAQIELVVIDWLRTLCGLPETAGGLFTSGGSMANVTALAAARHARLDDDVTGAVAYCSDQTHTSVDRALRLLGFGPDQLHRVPADDQYRLDPESLEEAIAADRAAGRRPFCIIANAGTTNTGAVDPLPALAALADAEDLWLHVDGAYGAPTVVCERGQNRLVGIERVDSLTLDPHKWLFQPFEIGGVLVRDEQHLRRAFRLEAEYLEDAVGAADEVNFSASGIQLTRSFRALKLWMTLKVFGREHVATAVDRGFERAEQAERLLRGRPGWTVVTPAQMGIITFRCEPDGWTPDQVDALTRRLIAAVNDEGAAFLTQTTLDGRPVLRLCPINPRTTAKDLKETIARLDALQAEIGGEATPAS